MSQHSRARSTPVSFQPFNDMDFIDYDAADSILPNSPELPQSSLPPSSASSRAGTAAPPSMNPKTSVSTQATGFPAPSHQYDLHQQQTGILPVNAAGFFNDSFFMAPSTPMLSADNQTFMHLDSDSSSSPSTVNTNVSPYFYPENTESTTQSFVNPSTILGSFDDFEFKSDSVSMPPPAAPAQTTAPMATVGRYYAGIHQHQAAYQQQQKALMQQRQAQAQVNQAARQVGGNATAPSSPTEERINRILDSMKSTIPPPENPQQNAVLPHIAKMKKEEDEMDEDERLLASDAGKKLTSKERRQLRNKVSARAFRSRRKEYISQLEHEVANKSNEVQAYQYENSRLKDENAKLSDFLRMVLSTPAFSTFLDSIPIPMPESTPASAPEVVPTSAPEVRNFNDPIRPNMRKDRNPNLGSVAEDGEWPLAYSNWGTTTPQVYSVFDLPQPNIQDLSGKLVDEDEEDAEWKVLPMPPVADGFFPIRDEKACINFDDYEEYEAPENLADLYEEEFGVSYLREEESKTETLDDLFPGTGVTGLLDNLEKIASGEAKVEELFEVEKMEVESTETLSKEIEREEALGKADKMLAAAEGVYRRVGLLVGS